VVPITTYNTVLGFGVSDQELFINKIIMFMAMLLLLLLPTTTETGTGRQHSDYVAPHAISTACASISPARTNSRLTEHRLSPTYDTHVALGLGDCPHIH
jgi:hypothetical protein